MSEQLDELLFLIRQHQAFKELLNKVEAPTPKEFRPADRTSGRPSADEQYAEFIYRSGRRVQHESWRQFLTGEPSQQEKS